MELQTAVVQSALNTAQLFQDNVALGRNLPQPGRINVDAPKPAEPLTIRLESNQPLATATATAPAAGIVPTVVQAAAKSSLLKTAGLVGLSMLGGGGGVALLGSLLGGNPAPAPQSSPVVNVQGDAGLLGYLEERGYNRPAKGGK